MKKPKQLFVWLDISRNRNETRIRSTAQLNGFVVVMLWLLLSLLHSRCRWQPLCKLIKIGKAKENKPIDSDSTIFYHCVRNADNRNENKNNRNGMRERACGRCDALRVTANNTHFTHVLVGWICFRSHSICLNDKYLYWIECERRAMTTFRMLFQRMNK